MSAAACLSEEQIAELVEGRLAGDVLARAERHLVSCSECRSLVASTADSIDSPVTHEDHHTPAPSREPRILQRNARVGRYVILELVGSGGMGRVYAARDPALDRKIALKLLRPEVAVADLESRLLREAKAMARISHPHVIAVHDAGRHEDELYIAMEFVAGGTLRQWVGRGRRTWREILDVYVQAGRGLAEAHAAGIIHRDFKPDNVLVGDDGKTVRVTDFGLARAAEVPAHVPLSLADTCAASDDGISFTSSLTRTGALVGTPVYMAPEQHAGGVADVRSDIFSFSVALYEALYGERPFSAKSMAELGMAKLMNRVKPPPEGRGVPHRLRKVLLAGLRAAPEERPASMNALLDGIVRAARRPRWPFAVGAAALGLGAVGLVYGAGARGVTLATPPSLSASAAATRFPVCSNKACAEQHGGVPWVCRSSDHACIPVASEECTPYFEPGDLESDETVWLGALFPTSGERAALVRPNIDAVLLARNEFAHATRALTGDSASVHVRRVAVAVCDDADADRAMRAAKHLADDVGVPAILGFRSGQEVIDLAGALLIQRGVLSVASMTTNPLVTQLPQPADLPRMVWRTTFGLNDVAAATASFINEYFEPRRKGASPARVALVRSDVAGFIPFGQVLLNKLRLNGKPAIEDGAAYQELALPPDVAGGGDGASIEALSARVAATAPPYVVLLVPDVVLVPLVSKIEGKWKRDVPRPTYLIAADVPDWLEEFLGASVERRRRVFGVMATSASAANAHFVIRYNDAYEKHVTRTDNPGSSYDAFYLLALATNAVAREPVTGQTLSRGLMSLLPPGRPVEVGPMQLLEGLSQLERGGQIDVEGTMSPLDLDPGAGEARFNFALLCTAVDPRGTAIGDSVESGLVLRGGTRRVEGMMHCP